MNGAMRILTERNRQLTKEGFDADHDSHHIGHQLRHAAIAYLLATPETQGGMAENTEAFAWWPWGIGWWKPTTEIRNLEKAGALIAAEIDRLIALGEDSDI